MRLIDLSPRWLKHGSNEHAVLLFRCPHCQKTWLTCTLVELDFQEQCKVLVQTLGEGHGLEIVTCEKLAWTAGPALDFEHLSIAPSIDASASGHWHGHIKDGGIT